MRAQYMDRIYVKHHDKAPVHAAGPGPVARLRGAAARIRERMLRLLLDLVQRERRARSSTARSALHHHGARLLPYT